MSEALVLSLFSCSKPFNNFVSCFRLMTLDGALMGSVGQEGANLDHKVIGAIASNVWGEYAHCGKEANLEKDLDFLLVELEVYFISFRFFF